MEDQDIWSPEEKRWKRRQIEAALQKLQRNSAAFSTSASAHRRQENRWSRTNLALGLPSAVLAALAGVASFSEMFGSVLVGVTALLAAALSAVLAFFRPAEKIRMHAAQAAALEALADDVLNYVEIEALNPESRADAIYFLEDCETRKKLVDKGDPYPERWTKGRPMGPGGLDYSWLVEGQQ